jgi:hypothetical protein
MKFNILKAFHVHFNHFRLYLVKASKKVYLGPGLLRFVGREEEKKRRRRRKKRLSKS